MDMDREDSGEHHLHLPLFTLPFAMAREKIINFKVASIDNRKVGPNADMTLSTKRRPLVIEYICSTFTAGQLCCAEVWTAMRGSVISQTNL